MALASEIIARSAEGLESCYPEKSDTGLVHEFLELDGQIGLLSLLRSLNVADSHISAKRNVILMFSEKEILELKSFRDATEALRALFELEKENPGKDIVLVRAESSEDVRIAFKNYFSDSGEFIRLIESGCQKLLNKHFVHFDGNTIMRVGPASNT
jgi:hypothetical protein